VVNSNRSRVHSYWTNNASITVPGLPALNASIAFERPRRFRLRAGTRLAGPEVDLGSNDELFWFWVRRSQDPALYFCRHDQYATGKAWQVMPIEPQWLIDALGLVQFDWQAWHSDPLRRPDGNFEIRSQWASPAGDMLKITVVDGTRGWVLEQHLFRREGAHLASAIARRHRYDAATGVSLPSRVEVQIPPAQLSLTIDVGDYLVNQPVGDPAQMWDKPSYPGSPEVDLARANPPKLLPAAPPEPAALVEPPVGRHRLGWLRHRY
jgi:hypothetical protein